MTIFICWSGTRSRAIAEAVEDLLKDCGVDDKKIDRSDHIEKGTVWSDWIRDRLRDAKAGIVCLTPENVRSPWMHFEAGALAVGLPPKSKDLPGDFDQRRLFTLLHGVTGAEINGPLSAYQATSTTPREMAQMVSAIKSILDIKPADKVFPDDAWNKFESALKRATIPVGELISDLGQTLQRKTFNEPLHRCADQAWLARYGGARLTHEKLLPSLDQVKAACPPHERELFELLLTELDGYAMVLQALLLEPAAFELDKTGELEMDDGIRTCCEDRRLAIRSIATCLLHPLNDPLTDEAVRFMAAETNEERKMIVHLLEARIRQAWEEAHEDASKDRSATDNTALKDLVAEMLERHIKRSQSARDQDSSQKAVRLLRFRESCWDLDRIYYYLLVHYFGTAALRWESGADHKAKSEEDYDLPCAVRDVELEVERYRARSKGGSLMPLTYGLMRSARSAQYQYRKTQQRGRKCMTRLKRRSRQWKSLRC